MRISKIVANNFSEAQFLVIPTAGHMTPLTHPKIIAKKLVDHIKYSMVTA